MCNLLPFVFWFLILGEYSMVVVMAFFMSRHLHPLFVDLLALFMDLCHLMNTFASQALQRRLMAHLNQIGLGFLTKASTPDWTVLAEGVFPTEDVPPLCDSVALCQCLLSVTVVPLWLVKVRVASAVVIRLGAAIRTRLWSCCHVSLLNCFQFLCENLCSAA